MPEAMLSRNGYVLCLSWINIILTNRFFALRALDAKRTTHLWTNRLGPRGVNLPALLLRA